MNFSPTFLKEKLDYLNRLDVERLKTFVEIAIYGNETYNYPLAQKYIEKALEIAPNNIDIILNKIKIHMFIEPDLITKDIEHCKILIDKIKRGDKEIIISQQKGYNISKYEENLQYVEAIYYFSKKDYKNAVKLFTVKDQLNIIYKEISRYLLNNDNIDFSKYKNIDIKNYAFFLNVANVLNFHAMYNELYKWCNDVGYKQFKNINEIYYIDLLMAQIYKEKGEAKKGYEIIEKLTKISPNDPNIYRLRHCLFMGTKQYDKYWLSERNMDRNIVNVAVSWNIPRYSGKEDIKNKNILVVTDQGFGDNFMNYRYLIKFIEDNRDSNISIMVYNELYDIFKLNLPNNIEILQYNHNIIKNSIDYYLYMSHLPMIMEVGVKEIEQLGIKNSINVDKPVKYDKPTVAIFWKTNPRGIDTIHRSYSLKEFLDKIDINNILKKYNVISLQKDVTKEEEALLDKFNIVNLDNKLNSFLDSARYLKNIEKLYSIDSGIIHLAGAMQKDINMYLNRYRDCKWGDKNDDNNHYLYKNLKIFT